MSIELENSGTNTNEYKVFLIDLVVELGKPNDDQIVITFLSTVCRAYMYISEFGL